LTNGAVQRPIRPREKSDGARARSRTLRPPMGLNRTRAQSRQRCTCVCVAVARARAPYIRTRNKSGSGGARAPPALCARPPRGERRSSLVQKPTARQPPRGGGVGVEEGWAQGWKLSRDVSLGVRRRPEEISHANFRRATAIANLEGVEG